MPADPFALLGLPRQAALDAEALQAAYTERSRAAHPDHAAGDEKLAAELNAAREILAAAEKRLKCLIELEAGDAAKAWKTVPLDEGMMSLFGKVGPFLQNIGAFAKRKQSAASALAKALLATEEMRLQEAAEAIAADLATLREQIESSLPELDVRRRAGDPSVQDALRETQARLAYLAKWQAQVREAFMALV